MPSFIVKDSVAFVTGTNKPNGIGHAIVEALVEAGSCKVYATARELAQLDGLVSMYPDKVVPVALDVTDLKAIADLSALYPDVTLVVNNSGYAGYTNSLEDVQKSVEEIQVNYIAPLAIAKSFASIFAVKNQGINEGSKPSALVNINSIASFINFPVFATNSASKAASHSLTQAQRRDMKNSLVIGVYPGPIETDLLSSVDVSKETPSTVADAIIRALEDGTEDVFPDMKAKVMYEEWKADAKAIEQKMAVA